MQLAVTITLITAIAALWIRRHTWQMPWETAATLNVALQAFNVLLLCPPVSRWVSPKLHAVTGMWNVEELIGHICYIIGLAAVLYMVVSRLNITDRQLAQFVRTRIELPVTLFIPLVVSTFIVAGFGDHYVVDLVLLTPTAWLTCYWILYCAAIAYLLGQATLVLLKLRRDPRSTRTANLYLAAIGISFVASGAFIFDFNPAIKWLLIRGELVGYAVAAAYSWRLRVAYMRGRGALPDGAGA